MVCAAQVEIFGFDQVWQGVVPAVIFQEKRGDTVSFLGRPGPPEFRTKTPDQKIAKQRVKPVFLGRIALAHRRQKHILLRQLRKRRRTAQVGKQAAANVERHRFEQR